MKKRIQKWFSFPNLEILTGILFAALSVYMKKYDCSIIWIAFCLPWFIVKSIDKAYDKQKETLDKRQRIIENLTNMVFSATNEYERQECLIQVEIYKRKIAENYLDLCKKKIDTKTFLVRLHEYESYEEIWKSLSEK